MTDFRNKNIIIYIPFGEGIYGTAIKNELESMGSQVFVFDERPSLGTFAKVAMRLFKKQMSGYFKKYIKNTISAVEIKNIDYVLVIRAEAFTTESINILKSAFKGAKFILYLWDSIKYTNTEKIISNFHKAYTFDLEDSEKFGIHFRALFFINDYREIALKSSRLTDLIFVGKVHSDRYKFLKDMEVSAVNRGYRFYYYLFIPSRLLFFKYKFFDKSYRNAKLREFHFEMLPGNKVAELLGSSRASLDIQHPTQSGLTMRTIEVLGAKRKLITTNQSIKKYDFYRPENILVIDRDSPTVDLDFILQPYMELPEIVYEKYSLQGWVNEVFS